MKLSLNWLRDFVKIPKSLSSEEATNLITIHTAEVEKTADCKKMFDGVVIGEILEIGKHPNADKLSTAKVDIGKKEPIQLIFGQMVEMKVGYRVPIAVAPVTLPIGIAIEKRKLRGVVSEGMLCLDQELGLKADGVTIQFFDKKTKPGTPFAEALGLDDIVLEIDNKSLTHRPDLWGHYGFAREFSALLGEKLKPYEEATEIKKLKFPDKGGELKVDIETPKISPRFCAAIMTGVVIEESPDWIKHRLEACGVRPINNVVDITNYVTLELGQPMHAFDRRIVSTDHLEVRYARKGEKLETIDHVEHNLSQEHAVVTNGKKVLSIAGIIGGVDSEISDKTHEIIFEAANWNPSLIRKTSQKLGLRTEASQRFEKSLDPLLCSMAIKRACAILLSICKTAKLAGPMTNAGEFVVTLPSISVDFDRVQRKIGAEIPENKAKQFLKALGFQVEEPFTVTVPSWRATKDISIEDDIIEEIARMHGYDNISDKLPNLPAKAPMENRERRLKHKARQILSLGLGFSEVTSYSFYGQEELEKCGMSSEHHFKLDNYLSADQTHLRTTLTPNLLKIIRENLHNFESFKIYEIGRTYRDTGGYFPLEEKNLTAMIVLDKNDESEAFYHARGACTAFLEKFGAPQWEIKKTHAVPKYAHPRKCAGIFIKDELVGLIFEIHPVIAQKHNFDRRVGAFWINFTKLVAAGQIIKKYQQLPRFPVTRFDVSVLVDAKTEVAELQNHIRSADKTLVSDVELFDIFTGENIEKNKKACAFTVTLRAPDRTLTDAEMAEIQKKVFGKLQSMGGIIRGLN